LTVYVSIIVVLAFALLIVFYPRDGKVDKEQIRTKTLKEVIWVQTILLALWAGCMIWGEVRLTKGVEYDISECSFSEGAVMGDNTAILGENQTVQCKTGNVYTGNYLVTIHAEGISEEDICIGYYYNEDIAVPFTVVESNEDYIQVTFALDSFLDYIQVGVTNTQNHDIVFHSIVFGETK
jgi:hypothetical protein